MQRKVLEHFDHINGESIVFNTDSYKVSHYLQMPPDTQGMFAYIESRGGPFSHTVMFGLQYLLNKYLSKPVTMEEVEIADELYKKHMGYFNRPGWEYIVKEHGGYLPVEIKAVPEGLRVPIRNVIVSIESTDEVVPWAAGWVEAPLLRGIWYPTTVATLSNEIYRMMKPYWEKTSTSPESDLKFKLHDFGARGSTSYESSGLAGAAHLLSWLGTDTVSGIILAHNYYKEVLAGYSIAAAEHSTITAWGRDCEIDAYRNMIEKFGGSGAPYAVVSDSYNLWNAIEHLWGDSLREQVKNAKGMLVIRPDSGKPVDVVQKSLNLLSQRFGFGYNSKGFKVLSNVRLVQGDGVNPDSIKEILDMMVKEGFSIDNIAFGMGGKLHQGVDRDTMKWAMKCSAVNRSGVWKDVYKDPITDQGKASKKGRLELFKENGEYVTSREQLYRSDFHYLQPVFRNGEILMEQTFEEIRNNLSVG